MKKRDNPVFIFGALTAAVFMVLACTIFFPGCGKLLGATPPVSQNGGGADSLPTFLVISDIHLHSSLLQDDITSAGAADTGHDLWDTAQNKIRKVLAGEAGFSKPKFIIVLGDLPWHANAVIGSELESAHENSGQVLHDLRLMAEKADVPLIYVPGNNDPWVGDYHPFSLKMFTQDTDACKTYWPIITPRRDVTEVQEQTTLNMGYYSVLPLGLKSKLRVIVLNSTILSHKYTDTQNQRADATAQIKWLQTQLEQAKAENRFVLIAMHVPPGMDGYKKKDFWRKVVMDNDTPVQNAFLDLIDKYQDRIVGLLSSHTHMDGLRKLYNRSGKLTAVDISVPGITPGHGNNPAFKIVSYNPVNFELQNFTTLYQDFFPNKKVVAWGNQSFDFKTEFGCPQGTSIRSCFDTLNISTLRHGIQNIYRAKHGLGNTEEVNAAIDVVYE